MAMVFEYEWKPTFFHRLHPLTKAIMVFSLGFLIIYWWDPFFWIPLTIFLIAISRIAKVPKSWYAVIGIALGITAVGGLVAMIYTYDPGMFKVWSHDITQIVIIDFHTEGTFLGKTMITVGGLLWWLASHMHTAMTLLLTQVFVYSTSIEDICDFLTKMRAPPQIMFVFIAIFRFIAVFQRKLLVIINAQKLRGWHINSRNPIQTVKAVAPLTTPLTRATVLMVDEVTMATKIRGFGLGRPSPTQELKMSNIDKLIIIALVATFAVATYLTMWYKVGIL